VEAPRATLRVPQMKEGAAKIYRMLTKTAIARFKFVVGEEQYRRPVYW
jgi:hypothetical protein